MLIEGVTLLVQLAGATGPGTKCPLNSEQSVGSISRASVAEANSLFKMIMVRGRKTLPFVLSFNIKGITFKVEARVATKTVIKCLEEFLITILCSGTFLVSPAPQPLISSRLPWAVILNRATNFISDVIDIILFFKVTEVTFFIRVRGRPITTTIIFSIDPIVKHTSIETMMTVKFLNISRPWSVCRLDLNRLLHRTQQFEGSETALFIWL